MKDLVLNFYKSCKPFVLPRFRLNCRKRMFSGNCTVAHKSTATKKNQFSNQYNSRNINLIIINLYLLNSLGSILYINIKFIIS